MQRINAVWQASPLKIVGALCALSLAAMMAVASGASFTSTTANAGNIIAAGNLTHSNSEPGAILNVSALKPGESQSGTVDITNTGDVDGDFTLSKSNVLDSDLVAPLSARLDLVVEDLGDPSSPSAPVEEYSGTLGAMGAVALDTFSPNEAHQYRFTVTFPDGGTPSGPLTGDNAYKGDSVTVDYNWESVST